MASLLRIVWFSLGVSSRRRAGLDPYTNEPRPDRHPLPTFLQILSPLPNCLPQIAPALTSGRQNGGPSDLSAPDCPGAHIEQTERPRLGVTSGGVATGWRALRGRRAQPS